MSVPCAGYAADPIVDKLIRWGDRQPDVRTMLLTSTRARPGAVLDHFSDYDVVLVARDVEPFATSRAWVEAFGEVLVAYWDPFPYASDDQTDQVGNVIQYMDGLKIDWSFWSVASFERIVAAPDLLPELDAGYRVLLDKDGLARRLPPPTYQAYIPVRPSAQQFQTVVNDFFSDAPYVAKCLWRDELLPAKWCLDYDMKHVYLRTMLEWRVQIDHNWSLAAGNLGRGMKQRLLPPLWAGLERCYAGAGIDENWEALFATLDLFRQVAVEVAAELGYSYPHELDRRVTAYVQRVQETTR